MLTTANNKKRIMSLSASESSDANECKNKQKN